MQLNQVVFVFKHFKLHLFSMVNRFGVHLVYFWNEVLQLTSVVVCARLCVCDCKFKQIYVFARV